MNATTKYEFSGTHLCALLVQWIATCLDPNWETSLQTGHSIIVAVALALISILGSRSARTILSLLTPNIRSSRRVPASETASLLVNSILNLFIACVCLFWARGLSDEPGISIGFLDPTFFVSILMINLFYIVFFVRSFLVDIRRRQQRIDWLWRKQRQTHQ